jgi:hypothetical protein
MPTTYCLIPHPYELKILTVPADGGGWTLPTVDHPDDWFAEVAGGIGREVSDRFGMRLTALREIDHGGVRVCIMENHSPDWSHNDERWFERDTISKFGPKSVANTGNALKAIVMQWMGAREVPTERPAWERIGWYDEATTWFADSAAQLGRPLTGPIEQVKCAWSWSCIMRAPTADGNLYFKADYNKPPSEPLVIETMAKRWPMNVPRIVAVNHERRWMLMDDFGPERLSTRPVARWQSAVKQFGRIQRACADDLAPWVEIGLPDRGIASLKLHTDAMLDDPAGIGVRSDAGEEALTLDQHARLIALRPNLHELWDELASIGIPDSIVQLDFREGNMAISNRRPIFYDWSDTVISHPFFSACRCLDYIGSRPEDSKRKLSGRERRRRIRNAYLEAWADSRSTDELLRAFKLIRQLSPMFLAIRWYLEIPHCEADSSWGRVMLGAPAHSVKSALTKTERLRDEGVWVMDESEGATW